MYLYCSFYLLLALLPAQAQHKHSVLGNCSMRCSISCIHAVVSGFWNNLASHFGLRPTWMWGGRVTHGAVTEMALCRGRMDA